MEAMIAVVGATGNTGRAVVKELRQLGQHPVCIVRNADKALTTTLPLGANVIARSSFTGGVSSSLPTQVAPSADAIVRWLAPLVET